MFTKRGEKCMKVWNEWRNNEQLKWGQAYTVSSNLRVGLECRTKTLSPQNLSHYPDYFLYSPWKEQTYDRLVTNYQLNAQFLHSIRRCTVRKTSNYTYNSFRVLAICYPQTNHYICWSWWSRSLLLSNFYQNTMFSLLYRFYGLNS